MLRDEFHGRARSKAPLMLGQLGFDSNVLRWGSIGCPYILVSFCPCGWWSHQFLPVWVVGSDTSCKP